MSSNDEKSSAASLAGSKRPIRLRHPKPCPICEKPSKQKYHPFCSSHCANVDLNRWLTGQYAVPAEEDDDLPDELPPPSDQA